MPSDHVGVTADRHRPQAGLGLGPHRFHHGQHTACLAKRRAATADQLSGSTGAGVSRALRVSAATCKTLRCHGLPIHRMRRRLTACVVAACLPVTRPAALSTAAVVAAVVCNRATPQIIHRPAFQPRRGFYLQLPDPRAEENVACSMVVPVDSFDVDENDAHPDKPQPGWKASAGRSSRRKNRPISVTQRPSLKLVSSVGRLSRPAATWAGHA